MSKYLMKFKGKYRIVPNIDQSTNDFPRDETGCIDKSYDDIYIKCAYGSQIYHYGGNVLMAYIPSIGRGHNNIISIAKEINLINDDTVSRNYEVLYSLLEENGIIYDITENDEEIEFKFKAKDIELIAKVLKASEHGANISPFSARNIPLNSKNKIQNNYEIPLDNLKEYEEILMSKGEPDKLKIAQLTKQFLNNILTSYRQYKHINVKADMKSKMLKGKNYIHNIGAWEYYLKYLKDNL